MKITVISLVLLFILLTVSCKKKEKKAKPLNIKQSPKYKNPNAIRDRHKKNNLPLYRLSEISWHLNKSSTTEIPTEITTDSYEETTTSSTTTAKTTTKTGTGKKTKHRPAYLPDWHVLNRPRSWHPSYMDYCDPYHCNDYHKPACGLHRRKMKFQWFQSGCHIIMNNRCANYRGFLKFDQVDTKYCRAYVMYALREGCPESCTDVQKPVCAINLEGDEPVVFKNRCHLYSRNCRGTMQHYVEVSADVCLKDTGLIIQALDAITSLELTKNGVNNYTEETDNETIEQKYFIE